MEVLCFGTDEDVITYVTIAMAREAVLSAKMWGNGTS